MRSRRHRLQVSTFPFLAVLLCAMGALLLVLLVMDRRAHDAARARADQAARRAAEVAAREAEGRRAERELERLAARRAAEAEHARMEGEAAQLRGDTQSVDEQISQAAARIRAAENDEAALKAKLEVADAQARAEEQALIQVRGAEEMEAARTEASRQALAQTTADLARLERVLAGLKAEREKGQRTYSVVPYNGKRGENRRPVYVECAEGGVVFHPDRLSMPKTTDSEALRAEVERRLTRQKERLPSTQAAGFSPYLMLLVRPDGVLSYYRLREALLNLKVDFGYELIDADWVLDFPADEAAPAPAWTTAAKPAAAPPASKEAAAPPLGLTPFRSPAESPAPLAPSRGPGGNGAAAQSGDGPRTPGPAGSGVALGPPSPAGPDVAAKPPGTAAALATPGAARVTEFGSSGGRDDAAAVSSGVSPGKKSPFAAADELTGSASPAKRDGRSGAAGSAGAGHPTIPPPSGPNGQTPVSEKPGTAGDPDDDPFLRTPPPPLPKAPRTAPTLRPARLSGDRDWIIYVECKPEGVVIYPTQLLVPEAVLSRPSGSNPLLQWIQQLIDRKQAAVRPGDAPYRPEVRFLIHRDAERTYHTAYPLLDALAAPKTAENLGPEDDVQAIIAGHY